MTGERSTATDNREMLLSLLLVASLAARDLRPELQVEGRVTEISVSPAGDLWIGTALGYAYRSGDGGRTWGEVELPVRKRRPDTFLSDHIDRFSWFDARRGIVTGYIGENQDQILLTDDGGATWKPVDISADDEGFWIYDAHLKSDGHAWLVGSSGVVLHSSDYGLTWTALSRPFDEDERTMSVWFASPDVGVVSTIFSGAIAITEDAGKTWHPFEASGREDVVSGCPKENDRRIPKIAVHEERVWILQCGGVFEAALREPRTWKRVTAGGKPLIDFAVAEDGIVGVTSEAEVVHVGTDGTSRPLQQLERTPLWMGASGARVVALDGTLKVTSFDGAAWLQSRMFGKGIATSWPIQTLDRGDGDVLWGISSFYLYRSEDGAKTWDRIAELPAAANRILIQGDGNVMLADGHGWVGRWIVSANRLEPVPVLDGLDIVGAFRRKDLWIVYGGRQYDTAGRINISQTFFSGQFAGSVDYGFVAASTDGGVTWKVIDRWNDEGPQAAFLGDDNRLTLLSWLCGVRQGAVTPEPLESKMQTIVRGEDRKRTPYVQEALVLDLLGPKRGWILGSIHHVGIVVWRTNDGGRSWKPANPADYPGIAIERLSDGTWIGFVPPRSIQRWNGRKFENFISAPGDIARVHADSRGSLTVVLTDGTVHVLDAERAAFRAPARLDSAAAR